VDSFREFPEWLTEHFASYKDRPVLTYCTGGIRCEMLTAVLRDNGFREVYQLDSGIVTYGKDPSVQGRGFEGSCYVFDERISVPINHTEERSVVGKCHHCGQSNATSTARMIPAITSISSAMIALRASMGTVRPNGEAHDRQLSLAR